LDLKSRHTDDRVDRVVRLRANYTKD